MLYPLIAPSTTLALKTGCLQKLANVCVLGRRYPNIACRKLLGLWSFAQVLTTRAAVWLSAG